MAILMLKVEVVIVPLVADACNSGKRRLRSTDYTLFHVNVLFRRQI